MAQRLRTLSSCALWVGVALALLAPPAPGRAASCTYYGTDFKSQDGDCTTAEVYYMCQDIDGYNNALCWDGWSPACGTTARRSGSACRARATVAVSPTEGSASSPWRETRRRRNGYDEERIMKRLAAVLLSLLPLAGHGAAENLPISVECSAGNVSVSSSGGCTTVSASMCCDTRIAGIFVETTGAFRGRPARE
jgi:hypothetical protein